jgi:large subunit ribosomal protein L1
MLYPSGREVKAGKIEFKTDKFGNVQVPVGKASFSETDLIENIQTVLAEIIRLRPAATKGRYIKKLSLCSTMSPSIQLDPGNMGI